MKTRNLGRTGLELTELGFGGGAIGNLFRPVPRSAAMEAMQTAWDAGIRYFDTAPFYGHGLSERRMGDFLRDCEGWTLSTKVGKLLVPVSREAVPDHGFVDPLPFSVHYDYTGPGIRRSVEASFARLGLNRIDMLWVHDLEPRTHGSDYEFHLAKFLESGLAVLEELKADGLIRAYGLGVNEVSPCLRVLEAGNIDAILLAGRYTLLDRTAEAVLLPLCRDRGVALVVGGVFNSGILATGARDNAVFDYVPASEMVLDRVGRLEAEAEAAAVPLAAAALQFPLREDLVTSILIGTGRSASVTRNLASLNVEVPSVFWHAADGCSI